MSGLLARAHSASYRSIMVAVAAAALLGAAVGASADPVATGSVGGFNQYLEDHDGKAFIPQKAATSGWLGDFNGKRIIGSKADTISLNGKGDTKSGYLNYTLYFDVSAGQSPGGQPITYTAAEIKTDTMKLYLDLEDVDFVEVSGAGRTYSETLTLTFLRDDPMFTGVGDVDYPAFNASYPSLTLDASNYGVYRDDGFGATDKTEAQYEIPLDDLGLTIADYNTLLANMGFRLVVTVESTTTRTKAGQAYYRSSREFLGDYSTGAVDGVSGGDDDGPTNGLVFEVDVPEPMSLSMLAAGSIALLRRRRR